MKPPWVRLILKCIHGANSPNSRGTQGNYNTDRKLDTKL